MKPTKLTPLALAAFLHFAPLVARVAQSVPALAILPTAIVLEWIVGALAITGAFHTVSAATGLVSASTVPGTVGKRLTYQVKITGREVGVPRSWFIGGQLLNLPGTTSFGLPPGLSFASKTMIISGIPTQNGTFVVNFTAYEFADANAGRGGRGGVLSFAISFVLAADNSTPVIVAQPVDSTLHTGESLTLNVTASSGSSLSYQWKHDGVDVPGGNSATLTITPADAADAGDYVAVLINASGTTTSGAAKVVVVPLGIDISLLSDQSALLHFQTIPGRSYIIESADSVNSATWDTIGQTVASGDFDTFTDSPPQGNQRFWRYRPLP